MKQNITKEQMDELSYPSRKKFEAWLEKHKYCSYQISEWGPGQEVTRIMPSIGQLIEFLGFDWIYAIGYDDEDYDGNLYFSLTLTDQEKLCDALWEAVKEKLEEE